MPTLDLRYQAVRHLDDTAIPFVLNSWLKSYRWSDSDNPDYYRGLVPQIKKLIKSNRVVLATLAEEPDCFVGWVCGTSGVLHYAYVKSAFRRDGVAKELIEKVCGQYGKYTFKTRNNAFLRYLDEKGFEYAEDNERDKIDLGKDTSARTRIEHPVEDQDSSIGQTDANTGARRNNGAIGATPKHRDLRTDLECISD